MLNPKPNVTSSTQKYLVYCHRALKENENIHIWEVVIGEFGKKTPSWLKYFSVHLFFSKIKTTGLNVMESELTETQCD